MKKPVVDGTSNQASSSVKKSEPRTKNYDNTEMYLKEIGAAPLLTKEEEVHFARLAQRGDVAAKNRMIESNLRLVVKIARRYVRSGIPILDLIEEGNLGLMHAVDKFDPERGFRFSTYGAWWIQQTIERAIMNQARTIRLPVHVAKELNSFLRSKRALEHELNHDPRPMEMAEKMDKPLKDIERLMALNENTISFDSPVSAEIDKPLLDTLSDGCLLDPAEYFKSEDMRRNVNRWLSHLTDRQQQVLIRRFGLNGHSETTLEQTGDEIGLTRERVRQIQSEALTRLKRVISSHGEGI